MEFVRRVTAPLSAKKPPTSVVEIPTATLVYAIKGPLKVFVAPMVALLPTHQKTLQALAPLMRLTLEFALVEKDVPILKMNCAFALPPASRVRIPLRVAVVAKL